MKSIFYYKNYRKFIEDFYLDKKSQGNFTLETFSQLAGFKSRSYFKSIFDGTRDLSPDTTFRIAKAMDLNIAEQQYFENLVYENQSSSQEQKQYYRALLARFKKGGVVSKTKEYQLLDYPFFLSALTLLADHTKGIDLETFANLLKIKNSEAQSFLSKMAEAGMIRHSNENYFYNNTHTVFHDSKDWPLKQKQFLLNQAKIGIHKVEKSYDKSKLYSQVFLGRKDSMKIYQQLILDLLNELARQESEYNSDKTELYQINLQVFEANT